MTHLITFSASINEPMEPLSRADRVLVKQNKCETMPKFTTLLMVALLASLMLTYAAARPEPSMVEAQHAGVRSFPVHESSQLFNFLN